MRVDPENLQVGFGEPRDLQAHQGHVRREGQIAVDELHEVG